MEKIIEYAPVLIPTLNRYEHLKRCVESLARCTHADKTELVIGLDYPPSEKYREGWEKITKYVESISGFRKVTVLRAKSNLGAIDNTLRIRDYALKEYQTYIYSEDDNEFSPCFLDFIDKALTRYWDDDRVTSICGYNYPVDMSDYDKNMFTFHQYSAWGVGRWRDKIEKIPTSVAKDILKSPSKVMKLLKAEPKAVFDLMSMLASGQRWGDALMVANNILKGHYSLFPTLSLCRNHGHDGSGLHCGGQEEDHNDKFRTQPFSAERIFTMDNIEITDAQHQALKHYFRISHKEKLHVLKLYLKYLKTTK